MSNNIQTVQEIYAAFGRGDVPYILERLSEDVEWEHDVPDNHGIPYFLPGQGRPHVMKFFQALADVELPRFEPFNLLAGANQVVGLIRVTLVNKKTGKRFDDYEAHVWTFSPRGQVIGFRHIIDTHSHWLANQP